MQCSCDCFKRVTTENKCKMTKPLALKYNKKFSFKNSENIDITI